MLNGVGIQIVSGGPDTKWSSIHYAYSKMIFEADKSIYIATPYFIPDDTVFKALRIAALSGIDVRIIIPARPDHPFVYWASLSYLGELLTAGVRCYKYEKGFIHSKMILIDSTVSSVGTANMDLRSFDLNFEVNAFLYDEKTTRQLESVFFTDLKECTEITQDIYEARSGFTRFRESISRLISPLL
jgi:cardiolipin synthase